MILLKKVQETRKDFDLTILTYPYLMKRTALKMKVSYEGGTIDEIGSDLSKLKSFGVDRVILAVNAEKDYDVNKTIEFVKELRKFCQ